MFSITLPGACDAGYIGIALMAAALSGVLNAVAGGGSIVAFPTLVWLGIPPIEASVTNAVGLWPSGLSGAWGFRREFTRTARWGMWLLLPSALGGALGAFLLLHTPPHYFKSMAPYFVLGATAVLGFQKRSRTIEAAQKNGERRWILASAATLGVAIYGGYFGAGLGILLLIMLGTAGMNDLVSEEWLRTYTQLPLKGLPLRISPSPKE